MARITYESRQGTVTIEEGEDHDIFEFLDLCRRVAIAATYHEGSWRMGVLSLAAEYQENEDE